MLNCGHGIRAIKFTQNLNSSIYSTLQFIQIYKSVSIHQTSVQEKHNYVKKTYHGTTITKLRSPLRHNERPSSEEQENV